MHSNFTGQQLKQDEPGLHLEVERAAFEQVTEPHRRELLLFCYRMLGSFHEAEDLVQETLLRAWRGRDSFQGRGSRRGWIFRIATNACLSALSGRARRVLPESVGAPKMAPGAPASGSAWLEPFPDVELEGVADSAPGPSARYEAREAIGLAFVAAIQHLTPRQRAALLLCDVQGWPAAEAAEMLGFSTAAVSSALQRALAALARRNLNGQPRAGAVVGAALDDA